MAAAPPEAATWENWGSTASPRSGPHSRRGSTRRDVRFVESEYAVPGAALAPVLRELDRWIESSGERVAFPVEVRFAAADDVALSTAYDRDSAYVAIHQYRRRDASRYIG